MVERQGANFTSVVVSSDLVSRIDPFILLLCHSLHVDFSLTVRTRTLFLQYHVYIQAEEEEAKIL